MYIIKCERLDLCESEWLDRNYLTKKYDDRSLAIATAIEFLPEDESITVYVIDEKNDNKVIWDSTKEKALRHAVQNRAASITLAKQLIELDK